MKFRGVLKKILLGVIVFFTIVAESQQISTTYAATLPFYNITTNTGENYTGKQVIYTYNGRQLPLTYPGILVNGTALADCEELFAKELGLQVTISDKTILITDGTTLVQLTLGSKTALVNGLPQTMNVMPVQILFNDSIKYYVPTRFIAETFGFSYVWVSSTSTVKITKTLYLSVNNNNMTYNGAFYSACYEDQRIPLELPVLYYDGAVYAPAKKIFEAAGCIYEESDSTIVITRGDIALRLETNNKTSYINGKKIIMGNAPVQITDSEKQSSYYYVPLEFTAEMLGFQLTYREAEHCYVLEETETTGRSELHPFLQNTSVSSETLVPVFDISNKIDCFEWSEDETVDKQEKRTYLTKILAYSPAQNIEVLELHGVKKADINSFMDNGLIVLELASVLTNMDIQYYPYSNDSNLVYALLTGLSDNTKLMIMPAVEVQWFLTENSDCVQLYIITADMSAEHLFSSSTNAELNSAYPDDKLIIPLPEMIETAQIQDKDNYLEKNFQIMLPGNHEEFYRNNNMQNPFYLVNDCSVDYNIYTDTTTLTISTKAICGYRYTVQEGYLEITVARPSDLYSKIIVLDAGHGGTDPGASKGGYDEKDLNFTILNTYTKNRFADSDIKVYFTRETDVLIDLYDRAAFASEVGADMFLSLHMNANNSSSVSGTEIFYSSHNTSVSESGLTSTRLAKALADNISAAMNTKNRGVSNSEFVVVKYNTVPAVLIELGFMTNKSELAKLTDSNYQQKAADAIYWSVVEMFELFPTGRNK